MITTKSIKPDKKELFKLFLSIRFKKTFGLWLILLLFIIYQLFTKTSESRLINSILFAILAPLLLIFGLWRYFNLERNKTHFTERYYEIDTDKISSIHIDGSSYTTTINNYEEVVKIKNGYIITFVDTRIWFLPFYAFNNYDDLSYFETEVADKINRNTYFKNNPISNIKVNFNIPDPPVKYSKKNRRNIKLGIIAVVFACLSLFIYTCIKNSPKIEIVRGNNNYLKLIKDSIKKDIDTKYTGNIVIKLNGNLFFHCNYSTSQHKYGFTKKDTVYYIDFWELKNLSKVDLKTININQNKILNEINKYPNLIIFYVDSNPLIKSKLNFEFTNSKMDVILDYQTEIYNMIDSINYKGFFGKVNTMYFIDEKGQPQIYFKYKFPKKALLLLYKTKQSFIIIRVNCNHDEAINENVLNFFNLK